MENFNIYYNKLNDKQKEAVDTTEGPVLVLAGPGTGKTELLSVKAANIIRQKKAKPENILILTYTNAAAKAMKERLAKILGPKGYEIEVCTFHSFANSIILESEEAANYIQDRIEVTDVEKISVFEYILDHTEGIDTIRPFGAPYTYRPEIIKRIGELKNEGIAPEEFEKYVDTVKKDDVYIQDKHIPRLKAFAKVYKLYEAYKKGENKNVFDERGRYDFDDMIMLALETVRKEKQLKQQIQQQYTYIMVDEYQDTNGAQLSLLTEIAADKNPNICCVGDDDQSIYRFQGASTGNFKIFKEKFPSAKSISLAGNYRSTDEIIDIAKKIINQLPINERVEDKQIKSVNKYENKIIEFNQFSTETEELLSITKTIQKLQKNIPYNEIAILVRKRDDILKVIDILQKKGIPYATDGKEDIANEARVKQMLDVLCMAYLKDVTDASENDAFFYRVIISDYFKVELSDVLKIINIVRNKNQKESFRTTLLKEFIDMFPVDDLDTEAGPTKDDAKNLDILKKTSFKNPYRLHFASWVISRLLRKSQDTPVHAILLNYIKDANLFGFILEKYKSKQVLKLRDLRALSSFINMVKASDLSKPGISLAAFLEEIHMRKEHGISLRGNLVTKEQEGVRVFTAHGSKGLEFNTVFIPFCLQDKSWPIKPRPVLIPLPAEIFKTRHRIQEKTMLKQLHYYDEIRLFYVASTRAKTQLFYSASPNENSVTTQYIEKIGLDFIGQASDEENSIKQSLELNNTDEKQAHIQKVLKDLVKELFTDRESGVQELISGLSLNPTSINIYVQCKRKFFYNNVLRIPSIKKQPLIFGTCVHKGLEETYKQYQATKKFPDFAFFKNAFLKELKFQGADNYIYYDIETKKQNSIYAHCSREVDKIKPWFAYESKNPVMPLKLEERLSVNISEIVFTGYYDKTEVIDEKKKLIRVVDYKTGKAEKHVKAIENCQDLTSDECDDYLRQLVAYKFLYERSKDTKNGYKVLLGRLVFIDTTQKDNFTIIEKEITEDMVKQIQGLVIDSWQKMNNLQFDKLPKPDAKKCGTADRHLCDYYDICWGSI